MFVPFFGQFSWGHRIFVRSNESVVGVYRPRSTNALRHWQSLRQGRDTEMQDLLQTEVDYLLAHHQTLAKEYPNKYLVIQGPKVHTTGDDFESACQAGIKLLRGNFLVRHVDHPEDEEIFLPTVILEDDVNLDHYEETQAALDSG